MQAKALVWQDQVEVLTAALQQANAEKAVLAADKARLEQEVSRLRLQLSMGKAMDRPDSKLGTGHGMATVLHVRLPPSRAAAHGKELHPIA